MLRSLHRATTSPGSLLPRLRLLSTTASDSPSSTNPLLAWRSTDAPSSSPSTSGVSSALPAFSRITPEHVEPAISALLGDFTRDLASFERGLGADGADSKYADVVERLEVLRAPISNAWGCVGHLERVRNSDALRDAHAEMQPKVVETLTTLGQSRPIYAALKGLLERHDDADGAVDGDGRRRRLDATQERIVRSSLTQMKLSGVGLKGRGKDRFNTLVQESAKLSTVFSNNVMDATKAFKLTLTLEEEVEGLPSSALALAAQTAAQQQQQQQQQQQAENGEEEECESGDGDRVGGGEGDGPWTLTLDGPSFVAAMKHLKRSDLREALYRAYITRASDITAQGDESYDNAGNVERLLEIRAEMAALLG